MAANFFFLVAGLAALVHGVLELRKARASRHWPLREAEVIESTVQTRRGGGHTGTTYAPSVRYRYTHEGVIYEGTRIMFSGLDLTSSRTDVERFLLPFAKGARITVRVNPDRPSVSVIEPGVDARLKVVVFVGAFLLFIAAGGFAGWWR